MKPFLRFSPIFALFGSFVLTSCDPAGKSGGLANPSPTENAAAASEVGPWEKPPGEAPKGMVWIPGGTFTMGSNEKPHEQPRHQVSVKGFWMDETEVTNAQFAEFVAGTGYVTSAEKTPRREDFPTHLQAELKEELLKPGANKFRPSDAAVPLDNPLQWWEYQIGANWRMPDGPGSEARSLPNHPVVCVNFDDAIAYCKWAGKRLPTEAEWEFAARGGLIDAKYVWGNEMQPEGKWMSNIWQGEFPVKDTGEDGFPGRAPGKSYPANGYGLFEMSGNVWEWVEDWYSEGFYARSSGPNPVCKVPSSDNPQGMPARSIRGGSWLCNDCYCEAYRVAGRQESSPDTASNHLGFRAVKDISR